VVGFGTVMTSETFIVPNHHLETVSTPTHDFA
jgi:hypothetical protein